jgi:hypothetical protein
MSHEMGACLAGTLPFTLISAIKHSFKLIRLLNNRR